MTPETHTTEEPHTPEPAAAPAAEPKLYRLEQAEHVFLIFRLASTTYVRAALLWGLTGLKRSADPDGVYRGEGQLIYYERQWEAPEWAYQVPHGSQVAPDFRGQFWLWPVEARRQFPREPLVQEKRGRSRTPEYVARELRQPEPRKVAPRRLPRDTFKVKPKK